MRVVEFADGFTSASAPTVGSLWTVTGTQSSATNVTAAGGITPGGFSQQKIYVQGSPGAVDISASPQIAAGTADGQLLLLVGADDTKTVTLENGTGLKQQGTVILGKNSSILYSWDNAQSVWTEVSRNDA